MLLQTCEEWMFSLFSQGCRSVEEFQCLNRIEEGTYGVVYRAKDKKTGLYYLRGINKVLCHKCHPAWEMFRSGCVLPWQLLSLVGIGMNFGSYDLENLPYLHVLETVIDPLRYCPNYFAVSKQLHSGGMHACGICVCCAFLQTVLLLYKFQWAS